VLLSSAMASITLELGCWTVHDNGFGATPDNVANPLRRSAFVCAQAFLLAELVMNLGGRWRSRSSTFSVHVALRVALLIGMQMLAIVPYGSATLAITAEASAVAIAMGIVGVHAFHCLLCPAHRDCNRTVRAKLKNLPANQNTQRFRTAQKLSMMAFQMASADPTEFNRFMNTLSKDEHACVEYMCSIIKRRLMLSPLQRFVSTLATQWALCVTAPVAEPETVEDCDAPSQQVPMRPFECAGGSIRGKQRSNYNASGVLQHLTPQRAQYNSLDEILANRPQSSHWSSANPKSCGAILEPPPGKRPAGSLATPPCSRSRSSNAIVEPPSPFRNNLLSVNSKSAEDVLRMGGPTTFQTPGTVFDPSTISLPIKDSHGKEGRNGGIADVKSPRGPMQKGTPASIPEQNFNTMEDASNRQAARHATSDSTLSTITQEGRANLKKAEESEDMVGSISGPGAESSRKHWVASEGAKSQVLFQKYAVKAGGSEGPAVSDRGMSTTSQSSNLPAVPCTASKKEAKSPVTGGGNDIETLINEALDVLMTSVQSDREDIEQDSKSDAQSGTVADSGHSDSEAWERWRHRKSRLQGRKASRGSKAKARAERVQMAFNSNRSGTQSPTCSSVYSYRSSASTNRSLDSGVFVLPQHMAHRPMRFEREDGHAVPGDCVVMQMRKSSSSDSVLSRTFQPSGSPGAPSDVGDGPTLRRSWE